MVSSADLDIYQGDDYSATVSVLNDDGSTPDLTGSTAQAQIRLTPASTGAPILLSLAATVNPPNTVLLAASAADTVLLTYEHYVWDLQLTATNGAITTILAGYVNVTQEVTR
jgi:hypothetical protein